MKPTARKGLVVICILYAITVALMIINFVAQAEPKNPEALAQMVQESLNRVRDEVYATDPAHIRPTALTAKEVEPVVEDLLLRKGSIININSTLILQCLNFAILLLVLYGWLWDPILQFLDERRRTVQHSLNSADKHRRDAEALHEKRQEELDRLRAERTDILDQARGAAEKQRDDIVEQAHGEAERVAEQNRERLSEEVRRARVELREEVAELATEVAARVLQREVSRQDHNQVIEDMLAQISAQEPEQSPEAGHEE